MRLNNYLNYHLILSSCKYKNKFVTFAKKSYFISIFYLLFQINKHKQLIVN